MAEVSSRQIIVIGGDGTINEVVNNYHGEDIIYLGKDQEMIWHVRYD